MEGLGTEREVMRVWLVVKGISLSSWYVLFLKMKEKMLCKHIKHVDCTLPSGTEFLGPFCCLMLNHFKRTTDTKTYIWNNSQSTV